MKVTDDAQRAALALEWKRSSLSQRDFAAMLRTERGLDVTTRILRLWCQRFGSSRHDTDYLAYARRRVAEAAVVLRSALGHVEMLLRDLDAGISGSTPPDSGTARPQPAPGGALHPSASAGAPAAEAAVAPLHDRPHATPADPEVVRPALMPPPWAWTNL